MIQLIAALSIIGIYYYMTRRKWDKMLLSKKIKFKYIARATKPDKIQVILDGRVIYTYNWIDGEDAHEDTELGKLHKRYLDAC